MDERKFNKAPSYPTFAIEFLLNIKFNLQKSIATWLSHCLGMSFISLSVRQRKDLNPRSSTQELGILNDKNAMVLVPSKWMDNAGCRKWSRRQRQNVTSPYTPWRGSWGPSLTETRWQPPVSKFTVNCNYDTLRVSLNAQNLLGWSMISEIFTSIILYF